jgi:hypothetical protein
MASSQDFLRELHPASLRRRNRSAGGLVLLACIHPRRHGRAGLGSPMAPLSNSKSSEPRAARCWAIRFFMWQHEPCHFGWRKSHRPRGNVHNGGSDFPSTLWVVPNNEAESKDHPTCKPVKLFAVSMQIHTRAGELCYEPSSGSGTQIMAAETLSRRCYCDGDPAGIRRRRGRALAGLHRRESGARRRRAALSMRLPRNAKVRSDLPRLNIQGEKRATVAPIFAHA